MTRPDKLDYRPCVGTMLINANGEAFVGRRIDNREGDWWQMPQGGVDDGEDLDTAMIRELGEETGLRPRHLEIVARLDEELYYDLPPELRATTLTNLAKVQMVASYRCAGHEYRYAAGGNAHFMMYGKLMPWDHVGGALMMREAGAHVARFDGEPYLPRHLDGGLIVAADKDSWDTLRREVFTG